ncbi:MAG: hypothetical protein V3S65_10060 [Candidatus Aminicenantaceae bacterium]
MAGYHDHLWRVWFFVQLAQYLQPAHARKLDIQEDQIQAHCFLDGIQSLFAVCRFIELITFVFENHLQGFSYGFFVVNDQYFFFSMLAHGKMIYHPAQNFN